MSVSLLFNAKKLQANFLFYCHLFLERLQQLCYLLSYCHKLLQKDEYTLPYISVYYCTFLLALVLSKMLTEKYYTN